jgi:carboxyl-terminal processing protease
MIIGGLLMKKFRAFLIAFIFIAIIAGFIGGASLVSMIEAKTSGDSKKYEKLGLFTKVLQLLEASYVEEVDVQKLIYGGIKGMLQELDPHSAFLSPSDYKDMKESTMGEFGGLGIEITKKDNAITVISPIEDTPAWEAGVKSMDKIIKINDELTMDMDLQTAVSKMRGAPGTKVKITVSRDGLQKPIDFTLTRKIIKIVPVKSMMLPDNYAYFRISTFNENTLSSLKKEISKLKKEANKKKFKGILIDLRNNSGGLLDQAVSVSNLFVDKGIIVSIKGRDAEKKIVEYAKPDSSKISDIPLVVLVNQGSASASEIVAGAIQDSNRGIITGQKTFGKGSVQTLVELDDKSAIKYTMAKYYTPSGTSIQATGIEPDIEILPVDPKVMEEELMIKEDTIAKYGEAKLKGHFENEEDFEDAMSKIYQKAERGLKKKMKDNDIKKVVDLDTDYQAFMAYNYLKVYSIGLTKQSKETKDNKEGKK